MVVGGFSVFFFNGRRVVQIASVPLFLLAASVALARAFLPPPPPAFLHILKPAFAIFKHRVHLHFITGLYILGKEIGLSLKGHSVLQRYIHNSWSPLSKGVALS